MTDTEAPDKIDAFDLLISALKDHEKRLDALLQRLENGLQGTVERVPGGIIEGDKLRPIEEEDKEPKPSTVTAGPSVICTNWNDFQAASRGSKIGAFEIEANKFRIYSMVNGTIHIYSESLPKNRVKVVDEAAYFALDKELVNNIDLLQFLLDGTLKCGLRLAIESARTVLSENEWVFELSYHVDSDEAKKFLARKLRIPKENIVEGKITFQTSA